MSDKMNDKITEIVIKGGIRMEVELISSYTVCRSCGHQFIPMIPADLCAVCESKEKLP
jgi:Zn finger protein HypA/HybF involved in hydrogenase expression